MHRRHFLYAMIATITPIDLTALRAADSPTWADFLHAIGKVESGHDDAATGDNGASIGRYQIQRAYWQDATDHDRTIGGKYEDCRDKAYAEKIVRAYFDRYAREALKAQDWQTLARIHNGGPSGHKRESTLPYWRKVKAELY